MVTIATGTRSGQNQLDDTFYGKISCPFHEDDTPSYGLYGDHAYCFACRAYESEELFKARTGTTIREAAYGANFRTGRNKQGRPIAQGDLITRINYWHRTLTEGPRSHRKEWFRNRGFTDHQIERFKFGHTGDHLVIPITDGERWTGFKWRADPEYCDPESAKYLSPRGQSALLYRPNPEGGPIVVCEGELDAALLSTLGADTITSTAGASALRGLVCELGRLPAFRHQPIYVATDPDAAGEEAAQGIREALPNRTHRIVWDSWGDISDYLTTFAPTARHRIWRKLIESAQHTPLTVG